MTREEMVASARAMRGIGLTYKAIGEKLGISKAKAWKMVNAERYNASTAESRERWIKRGKIALCDM